MIAFLLYNIFNLFIFGAVAIVFEKWWIILFALLFVLLPVTTAKNKKFRICDGCGRYSESGETDTEAIIRAEKCGWTHIKETNKDFCPECVHRLKEEELFDEVGYKRQTKK